MTDENLARTELYRTSPNLKQSKMAVTPGAYRDVAGAAARHGAAQQQRHHHELVVGARDVLVQVVHVEQLRVAGETRREDDARLRRRRGLHVLHVHRDPAPVELRLAVFCKWRILKSDTSLEVLNQFNC